MRKKQFVLAVLLLGAVTSITVTQGRRTGRIASRIDNEVRTPLQGHLRSMRQTQSDSGPVDPSLALSHMTLMFKRTGEQQADLESFLQNQQDPASRDYHLWLSPEEFDDRFGLSADDLSKVASWLQAQGFTIDEIPSNRSWIVFSGTAAQAASAFRAEIHDYASNGTHHFSPASEPSLPAAFDDVGLAIRGLDNFRF